MKIAYKKTLVFSIIGLFLGIQISVSIDNIGLLTGNWCFYKDPNVQKNIATPIASTDEYNLELNITWGGIYDDFGQEIILDTDGNIYITGYKDESGSGIDDAFIVVYNSSGDQQWNLTWGGTDNDRGFSIQLDSEGNIYYPEKKSDTIFKKISTREKIESEIDVGIIIDKITDSLLDKYLLFKPLLRQGIITKKQYKLILSDILKYKVDNCGIGNPSIDEEFSNIVKPGFTKKLIQFVRNDRKCRIIIKNMLCFEKI